MYIFGNKLFSVFRHQLIPLWNKYYIFGSSVTYILSKYFCMLWCVIKNCFLFFLFFFICRGGFYTLLLSKGFRLVSLNMNYCNNMNWFVLKLLQKKLMIYKFDANLVKNEWIVNLHSFQTRVMGQTMAENNIQKKYKINTISQYKYSRRPVWLVFHKRHFDH